MYCKVNSICSHIYCKHRDIAGSSSESNDTLPNEDPGEQEAAPSGILMDLSLPPSLSHDVDKLLRRDANEQKKKSCLFLLQLKEERLLTQAALNDVVVGCKEVFEHTVGRLKAGVSQTLAQFGVDPSDVDGLESVFDEASDPFVGLETAYLQDKFISKELGSIVSLYIQYACKTNVHVLFMHIQEPVQIQVGPSQYVTQQSGTKRKKVLTRDTFCYIPILSTLKQILQVQCVHDEILKPIQQGGDVLHDFSDGAILKQHVFFKSHPQSLQIIAYYDEVETCNPLGSSSGNHKLGCVFFTLGNIRPLYRSSLKSIFLVSVAKSSTIKANGIDTILKPFLEDLKTLHEVGITINFAGSIEVWKGALLAFLADNQAAHQLGGFKESFSFALRFCSSCLTDKEYSQSHFREEQFAIRDRASHSQQCSRLDGADRLSVSVEFGINRCSSLNSLSYFSVVENIPHDIMHDLFEGVIPYELQLLIFHCKLKSYFSIHTLNYRLSAFDFGYSEIGDKPSCIHDESNIRQTASQMWLLARTFSILVGDLVPRDDPNWHSFLKLLRICDICVAPALSADTVAYLEILIEEHHQQFTKLYPDKSITPKMHFMVHYPQQILNYGPLIYAWTMRHEAKLRIIKRAVRVSNFKNVCQSVAKRHQHLLSFYIHSNRLLGKGIETGPCKELSFSAFPLNIQSLLTTNYQLTNESMLYSSTFVTYNGTTLKPNAYVLWEYDALSPTFCKISTIIKTECEVVLVMSQYETKYYDAHYRAYCIHQSSCPTTSHHLCNVKDLHHYNILHPRWLFRKDEELYLTLKCYFETTA